MRRRAPGGLFDAAPFDDARDDELREQLDEFRGGSLSERTYLETGADDVGATFAGDGTPLAPCEEPTKVDNRRHGSVVKRLRTMRARAAAGRFASPALPALVFRGHAGVHGAAA